LPTGGVGYRRSVVLKLNDARPGAPPWLAGALDDAVDGEVRFDPGSLAAYSCDHLREDS
jgi:hypothetical protein